MDFNKKILVTGGTGFLGSYLLRYLVQQGYNNIIATKRKSSRMDLVQPVVDKITWVNCDILDVVGLEKAMQGVQQIYHTAAVVSFAPKQRKKMNQVNIEGTANIVNLALDSQVEKLVYVSSIAALGRRKRLQNINEKTKWERSDYNSAYGISKYLAEQEVWRGVAEGLSASIINPAVIMGAGFWKEGTSALFNKMYKGNKFYGTGGNGFVDVRDVSRLMIQLMESDVVGERFIVNGENWDFQKLFNQIADALKVSQPNIALTPFLGGLAWRAEWFRSKISGNAPIVTKETVANSFRTWIYENQKSLKTFDFKYTPLEQTIQETGKSFLQSIPNGQNFAYLPLNQQLTV